MAGAMHTDLLDQLAAHRVEATFLARGPAAHHPALTTTLEGGRRTLRFAPTVAPSDRVLNAVSKHLFHYNYFLSGVRRLTPVLRHEPFDILQAQMAYPYGAMAAAALRLAGRQEPLIVTLAGGDLIDSAEARYGYARFATVRALLRATFHQAALVRANSPLMAARAATLGCRLEHLRIVPSNIATALLPTESLTAYPPQSRARLCATQAVPAGPVLLAAGRLAPIKGWPGWCARCRSWRPAGPP
jgi:hypothetical protein